MPSITGPVLDQTTPALARAWHAVALSGEVAAGPAATQIWLLGQPWCLARVPGAGLTAWADRCPHRLAPLSAGAVEAGGIRCGYHGWFFSVDGRCASIPATAPLEPPGRARVEIPWGLTERYGVVWMAPQEPASPLFDLPEWDDDSYSTGLSEVVRTPAGAALLVDNFLDAAHFPYVHAATFGTTEAASVVDRGIERDGFDVRTTFETWYREGGRTQPQLLTKEGSASLTVRLRLEFPESGTVIAILFSCTPERAGRSRVYKLLARNDLDHDPDRLKAFIEEEDTILREDLSILERYDHECVPLDRTVEIHTRADRLSLAWRRLMADFVGID